MSWNDMVTWADLRGGGGGLGGLNPSFHPGPLGLPSENVILKRWGGGDAGEEDY